jgi:hypothetical protein
MPRTSRCAALPMSLRSSVVPRDDRHRELGALAWWFHGSLRPSATPKDDRHLLRIGQPGPLVELRSSDTPEGDRHSGDIRTGL